MRKNRILLRSALALSLVGAYQVAASAQVAKADETTGNDISGALVVDKLAQAEATSEAAEAPVAETPEVVPYAAEADETDDAVDIVESDDVEPIDFNEAVGQVLGELSRDEDTDADVEPEYPESPAIITDATQPSAEPVDINQYDTVKIAVFNDNHVVPKELTGPNPLWEDFLYGGFEFFQESEEAVQKAVDQIEAEGANVIIVPGDLTRDGEKPGHEFIAKVMEKFVAKDPKRRSFIVVGDHDINNSGSRNWNFVPEASKSGNLNLTEKDLTPEEHATFEIPRTTPQEYFDIYKKSTYDYALENYKDSPEFKDYLKEVNQKYPDRAESEKYYAHGYLSYASRVDIKDEGKNGVTVIALDTIPYSADTTPDHRDDKKNLGYITEPQIRWTLRQIDAARERNDAILVASHLPILPSFPFQEQLMTRAYFRNWDTPYESEDPRINGKTPVEVLADNGAHYWLSGHIHLNNISKTLTKAGNPLYQIQTGALDSYPAPIKYLTIANNVEPDGEFYVDIQTKHLSGPLTYKDEHGEEHEIPDFEQYLRDKSLNADVVANRLLGGYGGHFPTVEQLVQTLVPDDLKGKSLQELLKDEVLPRLLPLFGTKEKPGIQTKVKGFNITAFDNPDKQQIEAEISGRLAIIPVNVSASVTHDNLVNFVQSLVDQLDAVTQDNRKFRPILEKLLEAMGQYPLTEDAAGKPVSLKEALKHIVLDNVFAGDEDQDVVVKNSLARFQRDNVLGEIVAHSTDALSDALHEIFQNVKINKIFDYVDGVSDSLKGLIGRFVNLDDVNLYDAIDGAYQSANDGQHVTALLGKLVTEGELSEKIRPLNRLIARLGDLFTKEPAHYGYPEDDTTLIGLKQEARAAENGDEAEAPDAVAAALQRIQQIQRDYENGIQARIQRLIGRGNELKVDTTALSKAQSAFETALGEAATYIK